MPDNYTISLLAPVSLCYRWAPGLILFRDPEGEHEWKGRSWSQEESWEGVKLIILWWYSVSSLYSLGPQRHTLGLWSLWTAHNVVEALQGENSKPEELSEHRSIYM